VTNLLRPQPTGIPVPAPSWRLAPYWEACRRGELLQFRCPDCGHAAARPFTACSRCGGPRGEWVAGTGRGALYSWTVVWRPQHPSFSVPYAPAVVALDDGYHMIGAVIGCPPEELQAGLRLVVEFHPASDEITLPYFRPDA
jgi:uncharacterized protein